MTGIGGDWSRLIARTRMGRRRLRVDRFCIHTPSMTLKNAAFLALIGTALLAILLIFDLIRDVSGVAEGVIPAMRLLTSLIYAFAGLTVAVFFYVFHNAQL